MIAVSDVAVGEIQTGFGQAPDAALVALLTELKTATNYLDAVKVGLFTGALVPGPSTTLAEVLAAAPAFTGYALSAVVVWGTPHPIGGNIALLVGDTKEFACSGGTPADVITGYFLQSAAGLGPILLHAARLTVPFTMNAVGLALPIVPCYALRGAA